MDEILTSTPWARCLKLKGSKLVGVCRTSVFTGPEISDPGVPARLFDPDHAIGQTLAEITFVINRTNHAGRPEYHGPGATRQACISRPHEFNHMPLVIRN
jgi:hypothetical protein